VVSRPNPDSVAPALRPFVEAVVGAATALKSMSAQQQSSAGKVEDEVIRVLGSCREAPAGLPGDSWPAPTSIRSRLLIGVAAVAAAAALVMIGFGLATLQPPASALPSPAAGPPIQNPSGLHARLDAAEEQNRSLDRISSIRGAAIARNWPALASIISSVPEPTRAEIVRQALPSSQARRIYLAGIQASAQGDYQRATALLTSALALGGEGAYFNDDARYYLARAQQRSGNPGAAARGFRQLLAENPGSLYSRDARRFLDMLEEGNSRGAE